LELAEQMSRRARRTERHEIVEREIAERAAHGLGIARGLRRGDVSA
jgi:hypothetical protein